MAISVLLDNWTWQNAVSSMNDCNDYGFSPSREYIHFLEAVVLWDNISYINNEYAFSWESHAELWNIQDMVLPHSISNYTNIEERAKKIILQNRMENNLITQGAISYALIHQEYGLDVLLMDERAQLLTEFASTTQLSRKAVLDTLDKDLQEFYGELSARLGKIPFKFRFPILIDYLYKLNGSYKNLLKTAKELHDTEDVVALRASISELESAYQNRSLDLVLRLLEEIPVLAKMKLPDLQKGYGEMQISFLPISISYSKDITFSKRSTKPGFIFLKTLSDYGTNERMQNLRI